MLINIKDLYCNFVYIILMHVTGTIRQLLKVKIFLE